VIVRRYFGAFNKSRQDRRVFGDRDSGAYLMRFAWTNIVRHQMVGGTSSPDDPPWPNTGLPGGAGEYPAP
jgi:RNA-directed DNA polymerase